MKSINWKQQQQTDPSLLKKLLLHDFNSDRKTPHYVKKTTHSYFFLPSSIVASLQQQNTFTNH